jgi:positive regulator of sigma E activity
MKQLAKFALIYLATSYLLLLSWHMLIKQLSTFVFFLPIISILVVALLVTFTGWYTAKKYKQNKR